MSLPENRGAQLLAQAGSLTECAKALGVQPRTISAWRSSTKVPSEASRVGLERELGIPRASWDQRAEPSTPRVRPVPQAPAAPYVDPEWLVDIYSAGFEWRH